MTAQIAVMNAQAVALASDSAVTRADMKIFNSANKLFMLSKYHPVGIMVYGNADFMEIPWEVIIKIYRGELGKRGFGTLAEQTEHFLSFLDNGCRLFPQSEQDKFVKHAIYQYFKLVRDDIKKAVEAKIKKDGAIDGREVETTVAQTLDQHHLRWKQAQNISSLPETFNASVIDKYGELIDKAIQEVFERLPLQGTQTDQLREIAGSLFSKFPPGISQEPSSGIVIAGFGETESFPSVKSFTMIGVANNRLKYQEVKAQSASIGLDGPHASIMPFAQMEMVATFAEGIDPRQRETIDSYVSQLLTGYSALVINSITRLDETEKTDLRKRLEEESAKVLADFQQRLVKYRREHHVAPLLGVVRTLPKDELAAIAEALVNLTSFKRKVSPEAETVGGPIDVAVISKGDGFVWIKRKHYFKAELNPHFLMNYLREENHD
jgi:hypothetical protein